MNSEQSGMWNTNLAKKIYGIDGSKLVNYIIGLIIGFYDLVSISIAPLKTRWVSGQKIDNPLPIGLEKKAKKADPGCEFFTQFSPVQSPTSIQNYISQWV